MFKFDRATISSFYVASWFSFLLFSRLSKEQISGLATIFYNFFTRDIGLKYDSQSLFWYCIFFACLLFTFLLTFFITRPLGIYMNNGSNPTWVITVFFFLTIGFFVYVINQSIGQPMPAEIPVQFVQLLGGTPSAGNVSAVSPVWSGISDTLWLLGPIGLIFLTSRMKSATQEEGAE